MKSGYLIVSGEKFEWVPQAAPGSLDLLEWQRINRVRSAQAFWMSDIDHPSHDRIFHNAGITREQALSRSAS